MIKAKDILEQAVVSLQADSFIEEVVDLFICHRITGIPIVDKNNFLIGMITEKDLLGHVFDPHLEEKKVRDFMSTKVVAISEDTPITEICSMLAESTFRRVPIVNSAKELIGVISRTDIIAYISRNRNQIVKIHNND